MLLWNKNNGPPLVEFLATVFFLWVSGPSVSASLVSLVADQHWYVDSQAQPGGDGTSWKAAWSNFSEIHWSKISPGDTIFLSGGKKEKVYRGSLVVGASGEPGNPITITRATDPEHSGTPILDGEYGLTNWYGVDLGWANDPPSHVVVSRLRVQHFASAGLSARLVTAGVVFENNEVICGTQNSDNPRGIDIRWSENVIVRNNHVTAPKTTPAQTDGIYLQGNQQFLIDGNRVVISNLDGEGHSDALQLFENGDGVIRNNFFIGPAAGDDNHTVVIEAQQSDTQLDVYNNVSVMRGKLYNFMIFRNHSNQTQGHINLFHNTFYNGARALSIEDYQNVEVRNNIIYSINGQHLFVVDGPAENQISHNLVGVDPQFVSAPKQDFKLLRSSPAINAGTRLNQIDKDIFGVQRPQGTAPDIGAFEFLDGK